MMPPADLQELFELCPNFYADIKFTHNKGMYWGFSDLHTVSDLDFRFHQRWAQSIERYPDRYMYGSDWKFGLNKSSRQAMSDFVGHITMVRKIVGSLRADAQDKFMFENARRIFSLP